MDASQHQVNQYADEAFVLYGEGELSPSAYKQAKKRLKKKALPQYQVEYDDWFNY